MITRLCVSSAAAFVLVAPLVGCLNSFATFQGTKTAAVAHVAGSALDVESENGSITIIISARPDVQIESRIVASTAERLAAVVIESVRKPDGALSVHAIWPGGARGSEGCSFTITLPDTKGLTLKTSNGSIKANDTTGVANVRTSNGSVDLLNHVGEVKARASNGSVGVTLAGESIGPALIETSNGNITLEVGQAFSGAIKASTSNGKISFEGFDTPAANNAIQVGTSTTPSTVKSSNGRITIRRRK